MHHQLMYVKRFAYIFVAVYADIGTLIHCGFENRDIQGHLSLPSWKARGYQFISMSIVVNKVSTFQRKR